MKSIFKNKKTVSFLASGRGSNFSATARKIFEKEINAKLGILICDKPDAKALSISKEEFKMNSYFVDPKSYLSKSEHEEEMVRLLKEVKTDLVVTAGYMRILSPYFVKEFKNRIINIHPALLPSFPGLNAQKQALDYGVKITGCTSHFIDDGVDTGPIIMQSVIRIYDNDLLSDVSARIIAEEHKILPESVKLFCEDKLRIVGRSVIIR